MATRERVDRAELIQLLILLALVAGFYFVVIPVGIPDPDGFRLDEGLPPSFSARLAAGLAALVMLLRLGRILVRRPGRDQSADSAAPVEDAPTPLSGRVWAGVAVALLFAFGLVPLLGFLPASVVALAATLWMLGERQLMRLGLYSMLVTGAVWFLFSYLLSVRLPKGLILPILTGGS